MFATVEAAIDSLYYVPVFVAIDAEGEQHIFETKDDAATEGYWTGFAASVHIDDILSGADVI